VRKVNRKKIALYFKESKIWRLFFILTIFGIIAIVVGINEREAAPAVPVGAALIIIGLAILFLSPKRPSDKKMDAWLDVDLENISKRALNKTSLHEEDLVSDTVYVIGPRFWDIAGAKIGIRKGKDDFIRYTPVGVTIIFFTQHQLVGYQCALDLYTGHPLNESSDEFFYKDVVAVTTRTESETFNLSKSEVRSFKKTFLDKLVINDTLQLKKAEKFVLTTSGGTALQVVLSDPNIEDLAGGGTLPKDRADAAIRSVRKMLREKKID
jgi:hypothetical protein